VTATVERIVPCCVHVSCLLVRILKDYSSLPPDTVTATVERIVPCCVHVSSLLVNVWSSRCQQQRVSWLRASRKFGAVNYMLCFGPFMNFYSLFPPFPSDLVKFCIRDLHMTLLCIFWVSWKSTWGGGSFIMDVNEITFICVPLNCMAFWQWRTSG